MFWFQLAVVLLLLAAVGWLAVGGGGHMSESVPDRADLALPPDRLVVADDLDRVRFSVGLRGYRMQEVDDVLDRLAREVESRDRRIAELEGHAEPSLPAGPASPDEIAAEAFGPAAVAAEPGAATEVIGTAPAADLLPLPED